MVRIDMEAVKEIESGGNPMAHNEKEDSRGLYQISPDVLREYNIFNQKMAKPEDLFDPKKNEEIADWYLHERIPEMLRYFGIPYTKDNVLIAYNFGIGNLRKRLPIPKSTYAYLDKYFKLTRSN